MNISRLLLSLVAVIARVSLTLALECPYNVTDCNCDDWFLSCEHLTDIPPLRTGNTIDYAYFDAGNIVTIPANSLPAGLRTLEFNSNPLTNISPDAFTSSATSLQSLTIRNAQLTRLPSALLNLTNLMVLEITNTHIVEWDAAILQHVASIGSLTLKNVGLTEWPSWLSLYHSICDINLSGNAFKTLPDDAFSFLKCHFSTIYLEDCQLTTVPKALSTLGGVWSLDLSGNKFVDVNGRPGIESLASLPLNDALRRLTYNSAGLTVFPDLSNMTLLATCYLENNQLSDWTWEILPPNIESLYLKGNNVSSVPDLVNKSKLHVLDLSHNQISEISFHIFPPNLGNLYLNNNNITKISESNVTANPKLSYLNLSSNPISAISSAAFRSLVHLNTLDLSDTQLTQIPTALTALPDLRIVSMFDSPLLTCTCPAPVDLTLWYQARRATLNIYGDCHFSLEISKYLLGSCQTPPTD